MILDNKRNYLSSSLCEQYSPSIPEQFPQERIPSKIWNKMLNFYFKWRGIMRKIIIIVIQMYKTTFWKRFMWVLIS